MTPVCRSRPYILLQLLLVLVLLFLYMYSDSVTKVETPGGYNHGQETVTGESVTKVETPGGDNLGQETVTEERIVRKVTNKYYERNQRIRRKFQPSLDKIQSTCEKYADRDNGSVRGLPASKVFSLEPKNKLIICRTAKHGSTSWANNFVKIYQGRTALGTQMTLRSLERQKFSVRQKEEIIQSLQDQSHEYLAFFVCRNPIEKLLSVYYYLMDLRRKQSPVVMNMPGRIDFARPKPLQWRQFLHLVANKEQDNYLGLLNPNYRQCDPCTIKYDAVIKMENYDEDSGKILSETGLAWLQPAHYNSHGNQSLTKKKIWRIFKMASIAEIMKIVTKFGKDFELCGYDETLKILKEIISIKRKRQEKMGK